MAYTDTTMSSSNATSRVCTHYSTYSKLAFTTPTLPTGVYSGYLPALQITYVHTGLLGPWDATSTSP